MRTLFIIIGLTLTFFSVKSQNTNSITGSISYANLKHNGKINFEVYNDPLNTLGKHYFPDTTFSVPIEKDGTFKFTYNAPNDLFYIGMRFFVGNEEIQKLGKEFMLNPFLFEKGDNISLELNIDLNKAKFTGKGSDKLNCQYLINRYKESNETKGPNYFIAPFDSTINLQVLENEVMFNLSAREVIINNYKGIVRDTVLNKIKTDIISSAKDQYILKLLNYLKYSNHGQEKLFAFFNADSVDRPFLKSNEQLLSGRSYTNFLLQKEELNYRMQNGNNFVNGRIDNKDLFYWMYDKINKNYLDPTREKLLTTWLVNKVNRSLPQVLEILPDVLNTITSAENKSILSQLETRIKGQDTYPFLFIDEDGKQLSLSDFTNKVVVMDFWFNGCLGCTYMPAVFKQIISSFNDRKDIIFLSVSVDPSIERWKAGLKSGLYTLPSQLHVKAVDGKFSDFIKYYRINYYPHVMIIGKNNKLISASPTDPRTDEGKDIIELIKENL